PVSDGDIPQPPGQPATAALPPSAAVRAARLPRLDLARVEDGLRDDVKGILLRQQDSIIRLLKQQPQIRSAQEAAEAPFDLARWIERTRAACHARFVAATELSMISEARLLDLSPAQIAELLQDRAVRAAIEGNVQTFAHRITTTTYNQVKDELSQGLRLGESLDQMADRVAHVMGIRVEEARRIAQSEVTRSQTTGQMAAFTAAGITYKGWATTGDDAVREAHVALQGTIIPVGDMFSSGGATAYGPGGFGVAELDIGCRCWLEPVEET
ncbi:MAG: phage minor head protein, partial [Phycisphaerales bacterium]